MRDMITKGELGKIEKEAAAAYFLIQSRYWPGETEEIYESLSRNNQ
jgi:hypothetical protein